jgi:hypothetical protein
VNAPPSPRSAPKRAPGQTVELRGPVFIGGLAHTGKTPLRIALAAHPRLSMTRGTAMWTRHHGRYGNLAHRDNADRCIAALARDPAIIALDTDVVRVRRDFARGPAEYARLFALVHEQHAERVGATRWGDQLRGVEHVADAILADLPNARMIHMVRDPRDRRPRTTSGRRDSVGRLGWDTARWIASAELAARNAARYRERHRVVRYEDLLARPGAVLRDVCAFIGEEYDDALLRAWWTTSAATAEEPSSADGQRDRFACAFVERRAARQLVALGYDIISPATDPRPFDARRVVNRGAMILHDVRARFRSSAAAGGAAPRWRHNAPSPTLYSLFRRRHDVHGEQ